MKLYRYKKTKTIFDEEEKKTETAFATIAKLLEELGYFNLRIAKVL